MKAPQMKAWAIVAVSKRYTWVIPYTIRRTKAEAIDAFMADLNRGSWSHWSAYRDNFRAVKITVQVLA